MNKTLEYPLSPKYIPNWTVGEALRELIANALDTNTECSVTYRDEYAFISDLSAGISRAFWVIGEGNHGEIGQFGEGLKMAMLVLAREDRDVIVSTVGYTVVPSVVYSEMYESEVLALTMTDDDERVTGTFIRVACTKEEFINAHDRFLKLKPKRLVSRNLGILAEAGSLYINGVYASHLPAMWGYNITDKTMANRDRTVLDLAGVQSHILNTLNKLNRGELIRDLLLNAVVHPHTHNEFAEYNVMPYPDREHQSVWRAAFRKVFGEKACLSENSGDRDAYVAKMGFTVVNNTQLPYGLRYALKNCKVPTTTMVAESLNNTKFVWIDEPLTEPEQTVLTEAKRIAEALTPTSDVTTIKVVEAFPENLKGCTLGIYKGKTVYILRDVLRDLAQATGVLIHERLHGEGYVDVSQDFESRMTEMLGELAVKAS